MKIAVFSDIHGSVSGMGAVLQIVEREKPQKVVFCGDLFGGWTDSSQIAKAAQNIDSTLYFVKGNNDRFDAQLIQGGIEEYVLMYHFGRTLFFTHGDRYNGWNIPPILQSNDAIIFGHTHVSSLTERNGLFILNVGSVARSRDGIPCYLLLDDNGATICKLNGETVYKLPWHN